MTNNSLLDVDDLRVYYTGKAGFMKKSAPVKAVDGVTFNVKEGEVFGIVGESGCGKSTLGKAICRLVDPSGGHITFQGNEITSIDQAEMRKYRRNIQVVFQDPYSSLNARMSIRDIVSEPLVIHDVLKTKPELDERVVELLRLVGMDDYHMRRYPHELSGGQRQRIGIARAIALYPKLIIADEPVSALDVSIQSQVLNLLSKLREQLQLTYIFIAHDLSVVEHISDRIAVMYLGKIVEVANKLELYQKPMHPYTQALLSAIPIPDPTVKKSRIILEGTIPSPSKAPPGCKFHTRCWRRMDICSEVEPKETKLSETHSVYCHLYD